MIQLIAIVDFIGFMGILIGLSFIIINEIN